MEKEARFDFPRSDAAPSLSTPTQAVDVDKVKVDVVDTPSAKEESEEDLYTRLKELQRELEFVEIQEEYIKDEQKNLKIELLAGREEVKRIQAVPLVIGQFWRWTRTRVSSPPPPGRTTTFAF